MKTNLTKEELIALMKEARKNRSTRARNEFNKIEQDLKGDELKLYVKLRQFVLEDREIYEHYRAYNLILLDIIFDKDDEIYNNLTLEEKERYFHYERAKDFDVEIPSLMEGYYRLIKEFILGRVEHPDIIKYIDELTAQTIKELNEENLQ